MMFFDDNFGFYEIEDEEDIHFYYHIQNTNVKKKCEGCGQIVNIQSHYAYCDGCATKRERGMDI
tara:strand:- start:1074 stop:1265 length:192 start_codon:yes stop_codon:yes gene_type:complete